MDPAYPFIPILSLSSSVLILVTFVANTHLARNIGVTCLLAWLFFRGLFEVVNAIVWANDTVDRAPVWCDICRHSSLGY